MKLKDLTENSIKQFAGATIYGRGRAYYKDGMVDDLEYDSQNDSIQAKVTGNYDDYTVEISSQDGEVTGECTCAYEGYPCKHIVAVLLQFVHEHTALVAKAEKKRKNETFLQSKLKTLSNDELTEMILACAKKYPDFRRELMVRFEPDKKIVIKTIEKQIERAFPSITSGAYEPTNTGKQLKKILLSVEGAPADIRLRVHWAVADRILAELNEYGMDESSLENLAADTLDAIVQLFSDNQSLTEHRQEIIEELMDYYIRGNCGMVDDIYGTAVELCNEKSDYQIVIEKLEGHQKQGHFRSYHQQLLANLYKEIGDDQAQLRTLEEHLEHGADYWRLAEYWLKKDDKNKALEIVQTGLEKGQGRKTELYSFMQKHCQELQDYDEILQLLKHKIANHHIEGDYRGGFLSKDQTYQCLYEHYEKENNYGGLAELLDLHFASENVDLNLYKAAQKILNERDWTDFEKKILDHLGKSHRKSDDYFPWSEFHSSNEAIALAEIYNYKKDLAKLFESVKDKPDLLVKYEPKLVSTYPEFYLKKYRELSDKLIDLRGRPNYERAVKYIRSMKNIYLEILERPEEWNTYIYKLRNDNKKLRALHEALHGL